MENEKGGVPDHGVQYARRLSANIARTVIQPMKDKIDVSDSDPAEMGVPCTCRISRRDESYWCCAEIPLSNEWVFVVNTSADAELQLPPRSILAVSTDKLLDVLADLGPERVRSVYQLFRDTGDAEDALMINRLSSIQVGQDSQDEWRKVFTFHTESGTPIADQRDISVVDRTTDWVEIARFTRSKSGPTDVASIKD